MKPVLLVTKRAVEMAGRTVPPGAFYEDSPINAVVAVTLGDARLATMKDVRQQAVSYAPAPPEVPDPPPTRRRTRRKDLVAEDDQPRPKRRYRRRDLTPEEPV